MSNHERWDSGFGVGLMRDAWLSVFPDESDKPWMSGYRMGCIAREKGYGPIARKSQ